MQATVQISRPAKATSLAQPKTQTHPRILLLSSSLLTDRVFQHTDVLEALEARAVAEVWAMSARNGSAGLWDNIPATIKPFPEIHSFPEVINYLRRLDEFTWDYRLRPPSRLSMDRYVRSKTQPFSIRALKMPARVLAALRLETLVEDRVERLMLGHDRSPRALQLLRELRPTIVVTTGPHRFEEPAIVAAAKQLGIPVLALIASWDNISTKGRLMFKYDGYLLWSEKMRCELHEFYPQSRQVPSYVIGAPQYDVFFQEHFSQSRAEFCASQGLRPELPIVVYAVGSPNFIRGEYDGAVEVAARVARGDLGDVQLVVRPHPIHDNGELADRLSRMSARIVVQHTAQPGTALNVRSQDERQITEWVNTFRHADVVVNLFSTVSVDAAIFDRPIVNLDYDPAPRQPNQALVKDVNHVWTHFKPVTESGGMWIANNVDEAIRAVKTYLKEPTLHQEGRRWIANFVCGYIDGQCGRRMAQAIVDFATKVRQ